MSNTKYRVEWKSKATGKQGFGAWQDDLATVTAFVNEGNTEFPDIKHTIGHSNAMTENRTLSNILGEALVLAIKEALPPDCPKQPVLVDRDSNVWKHVGGVWTNTGNNQS